MGARRPDPPGEANAAEVGGPAAVPLTFKALLACLVLVLYGVLTAAYVLRERGAMLEQLAALDERQALEESLSRAGLAVSNALLSLRQVAPADDAAEAAREAAPFALEVVERSLGSRRQELPEVFALQAQARRRLAGVMAQPSRASLLELREVLEMLGREVEREGTREAERRSLMQHEFRAHGDRIVLTALVLGLGGLVAFGGVAAFFFARLASDLRIVGQRARAIVSGYRGAPLQLTRRDEVGLLMGDVNQLGRDLAQREGELGAARELRAHREKMAALGAMARTLSHEIGNPLAIIAGIAQDAARAPAQAGACDPEAILQQTRRIALITRQIEDFSGPRMDAPEPVDVGRMVTAVCEFMKFDPRFRSTRIDVNVAGEAPLVEAIPDELSEVLMNLVQIALGEGGAAPARLVVEAEERDGRVAVSVRGGVAPGDGARRLRTRQLVEGMGGAMPDLGDGAVGVRLPALAA